MQRIPNYYKERVCLNVLANSIENAKDIYHSAGGYVVVGLLSKNYSSVENAIADMSKYAHEINNAISVGLGAGDPKQSAMVSAISQQLQPQHVNQVFTGAASCRALLGQNETVVNALISPTGKIGYVKISTGSLSSQREDAIVPVKSAIALLKDMGASSVKYFPMEGLKYKAEYLAVAKACAEENFLLEPTGGIDLENFKEILEIALDAGVPKVIPHIYSSIINPKTGNTEPEKVLQLFTMVKALLN